MKQIFLLAFLLAAVVVRGLAQDLVFSYAERREKPYLPQSARQKGISLIAFIPLSVNLWLNNNSRKPELDSVQRLYGRPGTRVYMDFDPADSIAFAVERLTRDSAAAYEYRVLDKETLMTPWSSFRLFTPPGYNAEQTPRSDGPEMAYIGKYKGALDHYMIVEVRHKGMDTAVSSIMIWWPKICPEVLGVFRLRDLKDLTKVMQDRGFPNSYPAMRQGLFGKIDSLLHLRDTFASVDNNLIFYLGETIPTPADVEYSLSGPAGTSVWKANDFENYFLWLKDLPPGKYMLHLRFRGQIGQVTDYRFEIRPAWYQSAAFKITLGSLITAFFALVVVLFRLRDKQRRVLALELKNVRTETKLALIRARLNPHFIFNALSSIQGLVNKKDLSGANRYLGDFGELLRESLDNRDEDMIPLDREMQLLDTYLGLEQLRFQFRYTLVADPAIPVTTIEIPSLLLQPLVENAVKHGVSALQNQGEINILFAREDHTLAVYIRDNGRGFGQPAGTHAGDRKPAGRDESARQPADTDGGYLLARPSGGLGMRLTRERIALLHERGRSIDLQIDSASGRGTTICIRFNHWI
jgi:two-component system, LytTR family, sensor kinase